MIKKKLIKISNEARIKLIYLSYKKKTAHLGSALSCLDIIVTLYFRIMKNEKKSNIKDYFILSKGHAALALYIILAKKKIISNKLLNTYSDKNSILEEHPNISIPGVECSTGSLGHGLPFACGIALNKKKIFKSKQKIYVLVSDGECNEGSVWESFMFASRHNLDNLTIIIDFNKWQATGRSEEILDIKNLHKKLSHFNFTVMRVNGNDHQSLIKAFESKSTNTKVIIADTIKGYGFSFMQDDNNWHYRSPSYNEYIRAVKEIR